MSAEQKRTEAEVVAGYAQAATHPVDLVNKPSLLSVVVPDGGTHKVIDLERYLDAPRRKTGEHKPSTVGSFADFVAAHVDGAHTTIWVDRVSLAITAVLNDHAGHDGDSAWRDHRAVLRMQRTAEWQHWLKADGKWMEQEEFAEHLEDGIREIREPSAADMLEIAQSISGSASVEFKSGRRLDNGEIAIGYVETVQATAGRAGQLEIPAQFRLSVAPFYGEKPVEINARLRYRVRSGGLRLSYHLERPTDLELNVLEVIKERLAEEFPRVYNGTPA